MQDKIEDINTQAVLANKYVNSTDRNIFLTGKAGTGKTTFLHKIMETTHKDSVVAAPTGIAAINAGGVTLHSLFQLPLGIFLPSEKEILGTVFESEIQTPLSVMKQLKLSKQKRQLLQQIELLIIDEVSMLRADMADAIDMVLRKVRKKDEPFGGVQLLLIGDMQQLPPVVKKREWQYLKTFYRSMFFFDAKVFSQSKPVYIELDKIYRQEDFRFKSILNNLRDNKLTFDDLKVLNSYYYENLTDKQTEGAVFLTSHNKTAYEINSNKLKQLKGDLFSFNAEIDGEFPEKNYPVAEKLQLKTGAQVMFVKNDYTGQQRFFNGKIGKINFIDSDEVVVDFNDGTDPVSLEKYTWENKRYSIDKKTQKIKERIIGSFSQFPVKLAWAITIHKSQGLTFDKAVIDVSGVFAPGQSYVALSRLTSLKGLILSKPVTENDLSQNKVISDFGKNKQETSQLKSLLVNDRFDYIKNLILKTFNFKAHEQLLIEHYKTYTKREKKSKKQAYKSRAEKMKNKLTEINQTSQVFRKQIMRLMSDSNNYDLQFINKRVIAAKEYFKPLIESELKDVYSVLDELEKKKGTKEFKDELKDIEAQFISKLKDIQKAEIILSCFSQNKEPDKKIIEKEQNKLITDLNSLKGVKDKKSGKKGKSPTAEISLDYYKEGNSPEKIAEIRGVTTETVQRHLSQCVSRNLISVHDFISDECFNDIIDAYKSVESNKLSDIKNRLNGKYSFSDIRFAISGYFAEKRE